MVTHTNVVEDAVLLGQAVLHLLLALLMTPDTVLSDSTQVKRTLAHHLESRDCFIHTTGSFVSSLMPALICKAKETPAVSAYEETLALPHLLQHLYKLVHLHRKCELLMFTLTYQIHLHPPYYKLCRHKASKEYTFKHFCALFV